MKFYLMRHGEAEAFTGSDQKRQLTDRGARIVRERVVRLKPSLCEIDCILHSPYLRAKQTAEIVSDVLGIVTINSSDLWRPDSDPSVALQSIEEFANSCPLYVTHMPLVSLVEALCAGDIRYPAAFDCASISEIEAQWPAIGLGNTRRI